MLISLRIFQMTALHLGLLVLIYSEDKGIENLVTKFRKLMSFDRFYALCVCTVSARLIAFIFHLGCGIMGGYH